jgi:hypothetical protein
VSLKPLIKTLVAVLALSIWATQAMEVAGASNGKFFVPTGKRTGFGAFQEGPHSVAALKRAFGPPSTEKVDKYSSCVMAWPEIGVVVGLAAFGDVYDACREGVFYEARLTDPRWHTASGVHPGGRKGAARRASLRRCTRRTLGCGITGYALELHRTDCARSRSAGVIAHVRGDEVVSLIVRWRSCE